MPDIIRLDSNDLGAYATVKRLKMDRISKIASETIKAIAIIGGQWPHTSYMLYGVMCNPTKFDLIMMQNYLQTAISFFEKSISGVDLESYLSFESINDLDKLSKDLKYFKSLSFKYSLEKCGKSHNRFIVLEESTLFKKESNLSDKIDFSKILEDTTHTFSLNKEENEEKNLLGQNQ